MAEVKGGEKRGAPRTKREDSLSVIFYYLLNASCFCLPAWLKQLAAFALAAAAAAAAALVAQRLAQ